MANLIYEEKHNDENNDGRGSALHAGQWLRIDANRRRPSENRATEARRSTGRSLFESIIGGSSNALYHIQNKIRLFVEIGNAILNEIEKRGSKKQ
jgi:hypothetical protein